MANALIDPMETDKLLAASLERLHGVCFSPATIRKGTTGDPGLEVRPRNSETKCETSKAEQRIRKLLAPASDAELMAALVSLESATAKKRSDGDSADEYQLDRYVRKLRDFPRDVALWVLERWDEQPGDAGVFFPKTNALRDQCGKLYAWRRQLLPALQRFENPVAHVEEVETAEERAAMAAKLRALAGRTGAAAREQERAYRGEQPRPDHPLTVAIEQDRALEREELERFFHPRGER